MSRWIRDRDEYETGSKWFADWHRGQPDDNATMIDIDGLGYCRKCLKPHYIVEATRSKSKKTAKVAEHLAQLLGVPAVVVYLDETTHPGQILVDVRNEQNYGWMPDGQAWDVFQQIRSKHVCLDDTPPLGEAS